MLSFLIISCSTDLPTEPKLKEESDSKIVKADKSLLEIFDVKIRPTCSRQVNYINVDYVVKTEQINNEIKYSVYDEENKYVGGKAVNTPSGDNKATVKFNPSKSGKQRITLKVEFRNKEVYQAVYNVVIPEFDFDLNLLVEPLKMVEGLWEKRKLNETSYRIKLNLIPKKDCSVPYSLFGIEVYDSKGNLKETFSNEKELESNKVFCEDDTFGLKPEFCVLQGDIIEAYFIPDDLHVSWNLDKWVCEDETCSGTLSLQYKNKLIYDKESYFNVKGYVYNEVFGKKEVTKKINFN